MDRCKKFDRRRADDLPPSPKEIKALGFYRMCCKPLAKRGAYINHKRPKYRTVEMNGHDS